MIQQQQEWQDERGIKMEIEKINEKKDASAKREADKRDSILFIAFRLFKRPAQARYSERPRKTRQK